MFRVSHELDPEKFEPRLGIFMCLQYLGRAEEALSGFLEIEADFPDRKEVHNALGSLYFGQGRNAEAKCAHECALEIDPQDPGTLLRLSGVAIELGRGPDSLALAEQAMELDPEPGFACRALAQALSFSHRYDEASWLLDPGASDYIAGKQN